MSIQIGTLVCYRGPCGRTLQNTVRELRSVGDQIQALMEGGGWLPLNILQPVIHVTDSQVDGMDDMAEIWRQVDLDKREEQRDEAREEDDES